MKPKTAAMVTPPGRAGTAVPPYWPYACCCP